MKATSAVLTPSFIQIIPSRRPASCSAAVFVDRPGRLESNDELARKQEIVCAVILALCLFMTVILCMAQLAHF